MVRWVLRRRKRTLNACLRYINSRAAFRAFAIRYVYGGDK